uniref:Uncharacterized protein n=1 Tax=Picea sitchensis TaxID=3332 RepID=A9NM76_PICSI|nr:unknown [Picea sitchensis]
MELYLVQELFSKTTLLGPRIILEHKILKKFTLMFSYRSSF